MSTDSSAFTTQTGPQVQTTEARTRHAVQDLIDNHPEQYEKNALIRLNEFEINQTGVVGKMGITYDQENDIFLAGTITLPTDNGRFVNERVMTKTPFESKDTIKETSEFGSYRKYDGGRWHFQADVAEEFIMHMLQAGFPVAGPIQVIAEYLEVTPTPEHQNTSSDSANSGGGGITPDVEATGCPAPGCDYECSNFKQLRGHIGGKVRGQDEAHTDLDLRINDYR
jgi:hypothetical protein